MLSYCLTDIVNRIANMHLYFVVTEVQMLWIFLEIVSIEVRIAFLDCYLQHHDVLAILI